MFMPKAAVYKYDYAPLGHDNIGLAGEIFCV